MHSASVQLTNDEGYEVDDTKDRLDLTVVYNFLASSYWAEGISRATVKSSIENSWCFGLYCPEGNQVGFMRLITDYATFAYLADVFVVEDARGRGLGKWMIEEVFKMNELSSLRRVVLTTRDAHGLYERAGFRPLANPEWLMEILRPIVYLSEEADL